MYVRTVVAIGGGAVFNPCKPAETLAIDQVSVDIAKAITLKEKVNLLFLPTASNDDILYCNTIYNHFHLRLGCNYDHLRIIEEKNTIDGIYEKINWADIIYVGGGNTRMMMNVWREHNVDMLLKRAYMQGTVMTGLSAGSICWFVGGSSDSEKHDGVEDWKPVWVKGLGLVNMEHSPHYNSEEWRREETFKRAKETGKNILCLDDNCGIVMTDECCYKVVKSQSGANAYVVTPKGKKIVISEKNVYGNISALKAI